MLNERAGTFAIKAAFFPRTVIIIVKLANIVITYSSLVNITKHNTRLSDCETGNITLELNLEQFIETERRIANIVTVVFTKESKFRCFEGFVFALLTTKPISE